MLSFYYLQLSERNIFKNDKSFWNEWFAIEETPSVSQKTYKNINN